MQSFTHMHTHTHMGTCTHTHTHIIAAQKRSTYDRYGKEGLKAGGGSK